MRKELGGGAAMNETSVLLSVKTGDPFNGGPLERKKVFVPVRQGASPPVPPLWNAPLQLPPFPVGKYF